MSTIRIIGVAALAAFAGFASELGLIAANPPTLSPTAAQLSLSTVFLLLLIAATFLVGVLKSVISRVQPTNLFLHYFGGFLVLMSASALGSVFLLGSKNVILSVPGTWLVEGFLVVGATMIVGSFLLQTYKHAIRFGNY